MIKLTNLSITTLTGQPLISNLSATISNHTALMSEEGNGKSTLIKAILNIPTPYVSIQGQIETKGKLAYLPQAIDVAWLEQTPLDFLLKENPEDAIEPEEYNRYAQLEEKARQWHIPVQLLEWDRPISTLSGGEKVKLQLLKLPKADVYVLDEPTNDLDIHTLSWLENWINQMTEPILFVSHDETLLRHCAQTIIHLERRNKKTKAVSTIFSGAYDDYIQSRQANLDKIQQIASNEKKAYLKKKQRTNDILQKVQSKLRSVSRQRPDIAKNLKDKMKQAKHQYQANEEKSFTKTDSPEEAFQLILKSSCPPNARILDDIIQTPLHQINFQLYGHTHIAITGNNGVGKSLLLKEIIRQVNRNAFTLPQNYFQDFPKQSALDYLDHDDTTHARSLLGSLHFSKEEMEQDVHKLSLGQQAKVFFAKAAIESHDILLLDEPTRNLSPLSMHVIADAIHTFEGPVICISHDRSFLKGFDIIYELKEDGLHECSL